MKTYTINQFRSRSDGVSGTASLTWDQIVELFSQGHVESESKESICLFNATQFKSVQEAVAEDQYNIVTLGCVHMVRRRQVNAVAVDMLIIDYDTSLSIEQAKERFRDYEYIGYTSYSHLEEPDSHRFRLIFPLSEPIPAHTIRGENGSPIERGIFFRLSMAMEQFAPGCDPVVLNPIQPYYVPSAPAGRIRLAETWHNAGKILDWKTWEIEPEVLKHSEANANNGATSLLRGRLSPEQVFQTPNGATPAREVRGKIQNVVCPFHPDRKGTEFLQHHSESGITVFFCKKCGSFTLLPEDDDYDRTTDSVADSLIEYQQRPFILHYSDRDWIGDRLLEIKRAILADTGYKRLPNAPIQYRFKSHILYLPEGSGKSRLALSFITDAPRQYFVTRNKLYRNQVIFACKSWKQVMEQFDSFQEELKGTGRTATIAWSLDGLIFKRFGVKVRRKGGAPFVPGTILKEETIREILQNHPGMSERLVRLTWNILGVGGHRVTDIASPDIVTIPEEQPDNPLDDFFEYDSQTVGQTAGLEESPPSVPSPADQDLPVIKAEEILSFDHLEHTPPAIIFTTFAQLRVLGVKHQKVPQNWIIWVDDPDVDEVVDIKPSNKAAKVSGDQTPSESSTSNYDVRPEGMSLGLPFVNHRCIYTTTERITLQLLEHLLQQRGEAYQLHGERYTVSGGKITILGTEAVQKKHDAIIPLLVRRLQHQLKIQLTLIADGIPAEFNHSTNKGRNDLTERNILVEVSQPHPVQVRTVCDALGLDFTKNRDKVTKDLMLDKMHQAVGRNSGFRTKVGFESVVLVDKGKFKHLVSECAYVIDKENSVVIDRTSRMARKERRTKESATPIVREIENFFAGILEYLGDFKRVKPDISSVLKAIPESEARQRYVVRLLVALTSYGVVRFDKDRPSDVLNRQAQKIWDLGRWVVDQVPTGQQQKVLADYAGEIAEAR